MSSRMAKVHKQQKYELKNGKKYEKKYEFTNDKKYELINDKIYDLTNDCSGWSNLVEFQSKFI